MIKHLSIFTLNIVSRNFYRIDNCQLTNVGKYELNLDYRFTDKTRSLKFEKFKIIQFPSIPMLSIYVFVYFRIFPYYLILYRLLLHYYFRYYSRCLINISYQIGFIQRFYKYRMQNV